MAEARKVTANTNPSPGSSFAAPADIDMDIPVAPGVDPGGNKYIKSIAKFINAWIAS